MTLAARGAGMDTEMLAVNALKAEGALLFHAEQDVQALKRRLSDGRHITIARDELELIVERLESAVRVACEYHLGAAELV